MENIINFLDQYWGVTLFGGITLGSVIVFAITQIKNFINIRGLNKSNDNLTLKFVEFCNSAEERIKALDAKNRETEQKLLESEQKRLELEKQRSEQAAYFDKVQSATFKSISYLVMASKLSSEDKESLLTTFTLLNEEGVDPAQNIVETTMYSESPQEIVDTAADEGKKIIATVQDTVETAKTLFEKYKR